MTGIVWGAMCLLVSAGFLISAFRLRRERLRFLQTAVRAQATIVAARVDGVGKNAVTVPTFEFKAADGVVHRAEALQPSGFAGAAVGRTVAIRYDPARPLRADLDSFGALWGLTLLRAGFGALFGLMGLVALLVTAL